MKRASWVIISLFFCTSVHAGFEIGNGHFAQGHLPTGRDFDSRESDFLDQFTQILTPLSKGAAPAKLLIHALLAEKIFTSEDLIGDRLERGWALAEIGGLEGVKRETVLPSGKNQLAIELFHQSQEIIQISLEGKADSEGKSAYSRVRQALNTFHLLE